MEVAATMPEDPVMDLKSKAPVYSAQRCVPSFFDKPGINRVVTTRIPVLLRDIYTCHDSEGSRDTPTE